MDLKSEIRFVDIIDSLWNNLDHNKVQEKTSETKTVIFTSTNITYSNHETKIFHFYFLGIRKMYEIQIVYQKDPTYTNLIGISESNHSWEIQATREHVKLPKGESVRSILKKESINDCEETLKNPQKIIEKIAYPWDSGDQEVDQEKLFSILEIVFPEKGQELRQILFLT